MKRSLFKGKSTRTKLFTLITVLLVLTLLAANLLVTYFGDIRLWQIDLTPEGFYSLSDLMEQTLDGIVGAKDADGNKRLKYPVKITFCTDPDVLQGSMDLRPTYFMALQMQKDYPDDFIVETVNVSVNPSAVSTYKTTSRDTITGADMIVSYGGKYRVVDITNFWTEDYFSYNGEYRMATIVASLTAVDLPVAYFLVGHGETVYDPENPDSEMSVSMAALADLIADCGMAIKTLDLSEVDRVPEDCSLLIINAPTSDFTIDEDKLDSFYYVSDTEKLDRYLVCHTGALIVNKGHDVELPVLENFLAEWGIVFGDAVVKDETNCIYNPDSSQHGKDVIAVYDKDETSLGYAYYGSYAALSSSPSMVFGNTGYLYCSFDNSDKIAEPGTLNGSRDYASFIGTTDKAVSYIEENVRDENGEGVKTLAAMAVRSYLDDYTGETDYSYIFCTNSRDFFSNDILGNATYANYDVMRNVINNISRTDVYADIDLGGISGNSQSMGGKWSVSTDLSSVGEEKYNADGTLAHYNKAMTGEAMIWFTVLAMIAPTVALISGAVVFIKRKFK